MAKRKAAGADVTAQLLKALTESPAETLALLTEALGTGEVRSGKANGKVLAGMFGKSIRKTRNGNAVYAIEAGSLPGDFPLELIQGKQGLVVTGTRDWPALKVSKGELVAAE